MASDAPPWANRKYSTPPPDNAPAAAAGDTGVPGAAQYSTPPPGGNPAAPPILDQGAWYERGVPGALNDFAGGFETGELDPLAGVGIDLRDKYGLAQSQTVPGRVGRFAGNVFNPAWEVLRPIEAGAAALRYGGPLAHALYRLGARAVQGGIAGAVMPGEHRGEQAATGAVTSAVLGVPGAAARAAGFPNLSSLARTTESRIPVVRDLANAARSASIPDFNRVWYNYILRPIGGRVPPVANRAGMADVERQVGTAIDSATTGMTFDMRPGTAAVAPVTGQIATSMMNLRSAGGAAPTYASIVRDTFLNPLRVSAGRLDAAQLRAVTSNLAARVRAIDPSNDANRALRRELDRLRFTLYDNALGGDRAAWGRARGAWEKFAIARDGSTNTPEGWFTPDTLNAELHHRWPLREPSGRAPHQNIVQPAQQALVLPGRAAANAVAGRTPVTGRLGQYVAPGTAAAVQPHTDPGATP